MSVFAILVRCEAVEEALAVGFGQIRLGAAARSVRGVPGTVAAAIAVGKTDLGVEPAIGSIQVAAGLSGIRALVAGPVIAGVILAIGESGAIGLSAGEHFMPAGEPGVLGVFPVAVARIFVVVQTGHDLAFSVSPVSLFRLFP